MTEKRMAFYAKILDGDKLTLNDKEAEEWRRDLPKAIEAQYAAIDRGCLPIAMTLANVRRLSELSLACRRHKTLDVSNGLKDSRALQWDWERGKCREGVGAHCSEP